MPNRLFYTVKLPSSLLAEFKYKINMNFEDCLKSGYIISLADSQMLRSIRNITGQTTDRNQLEDWYKERDTLKKKKNSQNNRVRIKELQQSIYNMMYIPQYITVVMEKKVHYEKMFNNGIIFNGKLYKRFSCSASQARVSTIVFIEDSIREDLKQRLDNGRDLEHPLAPSKYNAYFGLYSSATKPVSIPRFCIVDDYLDTQPVDVDFVNETGKNSDDIIEPKTIDVEFNRFDGSGIISPQMAEQWGKDLGEDYTPCQFCLRAAFTKGMVNEFDFVEWCKEYNDGDYKIQDVWGKWIDLRNIDIILSAGQVKLWDSWKSQEDFEKSSEKNGIIWGITKYSPKQDSDVLITNYQFLQTLDLDKEQVKKLCKTTVDYIQGVSYNNIYYSLLFMMGEEMDVEDITHYMKNSDDYWLKSLILNHNILNDKYSKEKIRDMIIRRIEQSCLGKIIVQGNFQCIVPDNFAYMQWITGQEVVGLLKSGEFYSQYWNNNNVNKIDCMRSPLTHFSEHYVVNLKNDDLMKKWFKYSYSGIIVNTHDAHTMHFAGSDYDFDILATTNSQQFIDGVYPNQRVVTYNAKKPKKKVFNEQDLYISDTFSFGTKIGQITNCSTTFCALIPRYPKGSKERKLLEDRVKMCCASQSRQIDKTKIGQAVKDIPSIWKQYRKKEEGDTPEQIAEKEFYNSLLADKKPYFFKYKYQDLNRDYNEKIQRAQANSITHYKEDYEDLKKKDKKLLTDKDDGFLKNCERENPFFDSDCVMNRICKYIEDIDFHINQKVKSSENFDYTLLQAQNFNFNQKMYDRIKEVLTTTFKSWEEDKHLQAKIKGRAKNVKKDALYKSNKEAKIASLKLELQEICSNEGQLSSYLIYFFYVDKVSSSKGTLWNLVGEEIFKNVKEKSSSCYYFPIKNSNGSLQFLYKNYSIERVKVEDD